MLMFNRLTARIDKFLEANYVKSNKSLELEFLD